jgi:hypothetical protein
MTRPSLHLRLCLAAVCTAIWIGATAAFSVTNRRVRLGVPNNAATTLARLNMVSNTNPDYDDWSNVEKSRPTRRDVFNYDLWVDHRSTDRFIGNLIEIFSSEIFLALLPACLWTSAFAAFICLYNGLLINGFDDFSGVHYPPLIDFKVPILKMPSDFFSLCTPSLALLLSTCMVYA